MAASAIDAIRQPEYTGENRCMACTAVNGVLAVAFAGAVGAGAAAASAEPFVAAGAAGAVLALSTASIWLRGYLVPGTPELTKRYMPEWLLAWFGKAPADASGLDGASDAVDPSEVEVDPERVLLDAGAVEPCEDVDDLCLSDAFADAWQTEMDAIDDIQVEDALATFGFDDSDYELSRRDDAVLLNRGPHRIGQWPSEAALVADVAGARALADRYPDWADMQPVAKGRVLNGLRVFLETCPDGSAAEFREDTVESCCSSYDVVTVECAGSGERLFEQRVDDLPA
ncbi:hypothetical protein G9C85_17420 [Halorubellus sp. JP-L1]|uniref:hypothetical protein n=1 Tax=Halorubellus sp. JP-L1 TaxID=2715753 RepID=UPI0014093CFA|nr:hypothetical protein [Halorubellus sp. JP-L1]NHN43400.1 hypothetical protein [Halorubellus sp. JP-L1]